MMASISRVRRRTAAPYALRSLLLATCWVATEPRLVHASEQIVYTALADTPGPLRGTIYIANADGSNPRALAAGLEPTLSPDGEHVAYITSQYQFAPPDIPPALGVVDIDGGTDVPLSRIVFKGPVELPRFTLDSNRLVFTLGVKPDSRG